MITSLSEEVGKTYKKFNKAPLDLAYNQLNDFIDKVNDKIVNRLQLVQQVYLDDYKDQTNLMREELKQLRNNLDAELIQQRSNEKMFLLEEERDFFREQVLKLNAEVNQYVQQNRELKKKVADIEIETVNYKTIAINYEKKIIKLQKELNQMANFKRQNSVPSLPLFKSHKTIENQTEREKESVNNEVQQTVNSHVNFLERRPNNQIMRNKTYSKFESATKASIKRYEQYYERDQIIDDCIKQIKKDIFFRSHDQKNPIPAPFDEFGKVPFDKFTRTDKKQLIQSLLSNDKILEQFNEFIIARNSQATASRMLKTKIGDDKFNEKFLTDMKRSFSKKMYDLKTNPDLIVRQGSDRKRY